MFPNPEKTVGSRNFESNDDVNAYFERLDESDYKNGTTTLEHCYEKSTDLDGEYVEKESDKINEQYYFSLSGRKIFTPPLYEQQFSGMS